MNVSSRRVVSLLVFYHLTFVKAECDRCDFNGNDPSDCKDYGLIDNSVFIGWHLGSEACSDEFKLTITSPDPSLICGSANSFVNELKFGDSLDTAKLGLGVAEGGFFVDGGNLKDEITIDGQTVDCEASESDCYNAMKPYFDQDSNGKKEMEDVCDTLENNVKKDRQVLQSTIRNRLCSEFRDGTVIPDVCSPLWEQLKEQMDKYPDKICAGFAFGTQNKPIPGCADDGEEDDHTSGAMTVPLFQSAFLLVGTWRLVLQFLC
jgi:hypothetical protein